MQSINGPVSLKGEGRAAVVGMGLKWTAWECHTLTVVSDCPKELAFESFSLS